MTDNTNDKHSIIDIDSLRQLGQAAVVGEHIKALGAGRDLAEAGLKDLLPEPVRAQLAQAVEAAVASPGCRQIARQIEHGLPELAEQACAVATETGRQVAGDVAENAAVQATGGAAARVASNGVGTAVRTAARAVSRAGAIGAAVDGTIAVVTVAPRTIKGEISPGLAAKYVGREATLGGVSAVAGVLTTTAVVALGASTGGLGLVAVGMAAGFAARTGLDRAVPRVDLPTK